MSDAFSTAFIRQELRNLQRDLRQAYDKITELRGYREQEHALIDRQARDLKEKDRTIAERDKEINETRRDVHARRAHYSGALAMIDYLMKELDQAHGGAEHNPARKPACTDESFLIESGPRKGQRPEKRDHVFFDQMARSIKEKYPFLGSWRALLREYNLYLFK